MQTNAIFTYRPNPVFHRSFLLLKREHGHDIPVGDYTVLDETEDLSLSEKKVMNLVTKMNGRSNLIPLGEQTKSRLLFHVKPKLDDSRTEVVFYTYNGKGPSRENAILTFEGILQ